MRVMISGYYGFGNAGDEAILSGMLSALQHANEAVDVTVLSVAPEKTSRLHGVKAVDRKGYRRIWHLLKCETDLFISGGGGLIQDRTSRRSALYYLGLLRMAHQAGVPTYMYAQGVGPVHSSAVRLTARRLLRHVASAGTRDAESARLLVELGLRQEVVRVTADPAFCLESSDPAEQTALIESFDIPWGRRPLLGVIWRDPKVAPSKDEGNGGNVAVAEAIARFAREVEARVVVFSLYPGVDDPAGDALANALADAGCVWVHCPRGDLDFRTLQSLVAAMDVNVSVRYHGLLFSALGGVPALALEYDPKVRNLAAQLSLPCLPVAIDAPTLYGALKSVWTSAGPTTTSLRHAVRGLRGRAMDEGKRSLAAARTGATPGRNDSA